jgi:hypothetical protein
MEEARHRVGRQVPYTFTVPLEIASSPYTSERSWRIAVFRIVMMTVILFSALGECRGDDIDKIPDQLGFPPPWSSPLSFDVDFLGTTIGSCRPSCKVLDRSSSSSVCIGAKIGGFISNGILHTRSPTTISQRTSSSSPRHHCPFSLRLYTTCNYLFFSAAYRRSSNSGTVLLSICWQILQR